MSAPGDALDRNDLIDLHDAVRESLPRATLERVAASILAGDVEGAARTMAEAPGTLPPEDALSYATHLSRLSTQGEGMPGSDGTTLLEDLKFQPVAGEAASCILEGMRQTAALLLVLHEGYPGKGALEAVDLLATEVAGHDLALVPVEPAAVVASGAGLWPPVPAYLVRHGTAILSGWFEDDGNGPVFRGPGPPLPADRFGQAWRVSRRHAEAASDGADLRARIADALASGLTGKALVDRLASTLETKG